MEVMFLMLSGIILAAGVLYWFWSHIQLTQKKVQLLENAVFELRGMLAPTELSQPEAPEPIGDRSTHYTDLEDDEWTDRTDRTDRTDQNEPAKEVRVAVVEPEVLVQAQTPSLPVTVIREEPVKMTSELIQGFTNLYKEEVKEVKEVKGTNPDETQTLEGMPIKDLRRMASERGITGTGEMRKKDLVAALRESVNGPPAKLEETTELTFEAL